MNETLKVKIEADIQGLESALTKANRLIDEHSRRYKSVHSSLGENTQATRDLEREMSNLHREVDKGAVSESKYQKEIDRVSQELRETRTETAAYQKELKRLEAEINRLTAASHKQSAATGNIVAPTGRATSAMSSLGTVTQANAVPALTSFSQVIQDAPYGIRGVANNITQLTSQFGYLAASTGGGVGALKALGSALLGPAGILFAVSAITSLLVTYGDKLSFATDETSKLKEETEKAREELDNFIASLNSLDRVEISASVEADQELAALKMLEAQMSNLSGSVKSREDAYNELNKRYPETLKNYNKETLLANGLGEAYDEIAKKIEAQAGSSKAQEQVNKNLEQRGKLLAKEDSLQEALNKQLERKQALEEKLSIPGQALYASNQLVKVEEEILKLTEKRKDVLSDIQNLEEENVVLSGKVTYIPDEIEVDSSKATVTSNSEAIRVPVKAIMEFKSMGGDVALQSQMEWVRMLEAQIAQLEIAQSKFPVFSDAYQSLGEQIDFAKSRLSGFNDVLHTSAKAATDEFAANYSQIGEVTQQFAEKQNMLAQSVTMAFGSMIANMSSSLIDGKDDFADFGKSFLKTVGKIIAGALAQTLATSFAGASQSALATGPAAVFTLPGFLGTMSAAVFGAFGNLPQFATGGIVGGNSYYGDKILARLNSGELILNQQQQAGVLAQMNAPTMNPTSGQLEVVGYSMVSGEDIMISFKRSQNRRNRIS